MSNIILPYAALLMGAVCSVPFALAAAHKWYARTTNGWGRWQDDENMPCELTSGALYMSEQSISMSYPFALHGQVDQVFVTKAGTLVPVETKTRKRHKAYKSDIWQLSVYAAIISRPMRNHPYKISNYGYVRTVVQTANKRSVKYHLVRLVSPKGVFRQAGKG